MTNSSDKSETRSSFLEERVFAPIRKAFNNLFKSESVESKEYADCIIYNEEGEVLLLHRTYTDEFEPGKLGFPGGGIDKGEDAKSAAEREVLEETGLTIVALPLSVKEVDGKKIHYFEAQVKKTDLLLDAEEHRGLEWLQPDQIANKELVGSLSTFVNDLLKITSWNSSELDKHWKTITDAFDQDIISEEEFFKARKDYMQAKKKEAIDIIKKGFDLGLIDEEEYLRALKLEALPLLEW